MGNHASEHVQGTQINILSGISQTQGQIFYMVVIILVGIVILKLWLCYKHHKYIQTKKETRYNQQYQGQQFDRGLERLQTVIVTAPHHGLPQLTRGQTFEEPRLSEVQPRRNSLD
ncbi:unknown [Rockfish nackednavirus]|nr:unknown [Rockfish nackednavirus]